MFLPKTDRHLTSSGVIFLPAPPTHTHIPTEYLNLGDIFLPQAFCSVVCPPKKGFKQCSMLFSLQHCSQGYKTNMHMIGCTHTNTHVYHTLNPFIYMHIHTQHRVTDVHLTLLAGAVKSCSECLTGRLWRQLAVEAASNTKAFTNKSHLWPLLLLNSLFLFFLISQAFPLSVATLSCSLSNLFSLSVFCPVSDIFCFFSLCLLLSLLPCFILPPSAELREGWYSYDCVALLSLSWVFSLFPFNCHLYCVSFNCGILKD